MKICTSKAKVEYHTNWIIAKCDQDLLEYYRWHIFKKTGISLMKPMNGAHISIVRGDIESATWVRNMDGEEIEFQYDGSMECWTPYIWLKVWGDDLGKIREKVGLNKCPLKAFHMSVGSVEKNLSDLLDRTFKLRLTREVNYE
jgi:hypothetical protein